MMFWWAFLDWSEAADWSFSFFLMVLFSVGSAASLKWVILPMKDRWTAYMDAEEARRQLELEHRLADVRAEAERTAQLLSTLEGLANHITTIHVALEKAADERGKIFEHLEQIK